MIQSGTYTASEFGLIANQRLPEGTILRLTFDVRGFFSSGKVQGIVNTVTKFREDHRGLLEVQGLDVTQDLKEFTILVKVITNPVVTLTLIVGGIIGAASLFFLIPALQTVRVELPAAVGSVIEGVGTIGTLLPLILVGGVVLFAIR